MSSHKIFWLPLAITLSVFTLPGLAADKGDKPHDAAWVKEKAKTCASCHGAGGVSQQPTFPTIAGQYESYLLHTLKGYRDGERKNGIMQAQVQGLSNAQIKALARFYSKQKSPLYTPALGE